jgi:hypothetical protein
MVDIRQISGDSLSTIPEEKHRIYWFYLYPHHYQLKQRGVPSISPDFEGTIFTISADEPSRKGEMDQERAARVERNVDRTAHRVERENSEEA